MIKNRRIAGKVVDIGTSLWYYTKAALKRPPESRSDPRLKSESCKMGGTIREACYHRDRR